jgi:predicted GNAT family acetyltransferase
LKILAVSRTIQQGMPMSVVSLHNKSELEAFFRRNTFLNLYAIGDLDNFFWQHTTWYALKKDEQIEQVVLLYSASTLPVLLAIAQEQDASLSELLNSMLHLLPRQFYAHITSESVGALVQDYHLESHGTYYKMALLDPSSLKQMDASVAERLSLDDLSEIEAFYRISYPDNWFDPRMLETGHYYGIRRDGQLLGVAGVHVYSERFRVAALGNVATHPEHRGQGLGSLVCARLCQELLHTVDHIGLNVRADNVSALVCYERLGFRRIVQYEEIMCSAKCRNQER